MPRPKVPRCQECRYAIKEDAGKLGVYIYCPIINQGRRAWIAWWDRQHTSPHDCPLRWTKRRITYTRHLKPLRRDQGTRHLPPEVA